MQPLSRVVIVLPVSFLLILVYPSCLLAVEARVGTIAHLSDLHLDEFYKLGSPVQCPFETVGGTCCRPVPGWKGTPARAWGEYTCDSPGLLVNASLDWVLAVQGHRASVQGFDPNVSSREISLTVDLVMVTGDYCDHHDLNQSLAQNAQVIANVAAKWSDRFSSPFIPVLPVLGNHDTWPVDQLCPASELDGAYQPLYRTLVKSWGPWLRSVGAPDRALDTLGEGGFYGFQLELPSRSSRPESVRPVEGAPLWVFGLNTLFYDNLNIANRDLCSGSDAGQWTALVDTIEQAHAVGGRVMVIGHMPPGSKEATEAFTWQFQQLVATYPETIMGSWWGHEHKDEIVLFRNAESSFGPSAHSRLEGPPTHEGPPNGPGLPAAVGHGYIAPSVMPAWHFPAGRLYSYDSDTLEVLDYKQYVLNLTALYTALSTSSGGKHSHPTSLPVVPTFDLYYTASEAYNLPDLSTSSWEKWALLAETNHTMMDLYWKHSYPGYDHGPCDTSCRTRLWCNVMFADAEARKHCKDHP